MKSVTVFLRQKINDMIDWLSPPSAPGIIAAALVWAGVGAATAAAIGTAVFDFTLSVPCSYSAQCVSGEK